ncbi:MAG: hemolysin family protein [candidate division KSB1 bacterium]|nr:hemolysin family protein [candidate division KSB1 bacterium]
MDSIVDTNRLAAFFALLLFSGLLSASESAFFSINKLILKKLEGESSRRAALAVRLLRHPRRLLIAILIGNTLVNVTAASLAAEIMMQAAAALGQPQKYALLANVLIVTFFILVFGEISPKVTAVRNPATAAKWLSPFAAIVFYLFFPLSFLVDKLINQITSLFHFKEKEKDKYLDVDEFQALLEMGEEQGAIEEEEREMLHSVFQFGETTVREIMVPRTDVVCIPDDIAFDELIELIKEHGHTRIPVYSETIDHIQGILNVKDLLPLVSERPKTFNVLNFVREPIYVPESKKIDDLLRLFQKKSQHMAIVVDEYGGTSGVVTLEDIIEELVGEIHDEYDDEEPPLREIGAGIYLADAKIQIDALNEKLPINLPEDEEFETLGGFILAKTGSLPPPGETIRHEDYLLIVEKVEKNRIVSVRITHSPRTEETKETD